MFLQFFLQKVPSSLVSISVDSTVNYEFLTEIDVDAVTNLEILTDLINNNILSYENLKTYVNIHNEEDEIHPLIFEWVLATVTNGTAATEFLLSLNRDSESPLELLATINGDGTVNYEFSGTVGVVLDSVLPLEHTVNFSAQNDLSLEYLIELLSNNTANLESLSLLSILVPIQTEFKTAVYGSGVFNYEFLRHLSVDSATLVEYLREVEQDGQINFEWTTPTVVLVPGFLKWIIQNRKKIWVVERNTTWTLNAQTKTWTLR